MVFYRKNARQDARVNMRGGDGTTTLSHLADGALPKNARLFAQITLPVGASIGHHEHNGETEFYFMLSGSAQVIDDGAPVDLAVGDTVVTPTGHSHSIRNTGDTECTFLACIVND